MKLLKLVFVFLFLNSVILAQNTYEPSSVGYTSITVGNSTLPHLDYQPLSLFGCNTIVTVGNKFWRGPKHGFKWNTKNQILSNIPYGWQTDIFGENFYVSKYYIASPPVFEGGKKALKKPNTLYDIGLVTPDEFVFNGDKPVQLVYLNYDILKPMYIQYIKVEFDESFNRLKKDFVPFKVECTDFPWLNTNEVSNGRGASGIGFLKKSDKHKSRLFLPYYYIDGKTKKYLNCTVSVLNDILFHYEVKFEIYGKKTDVINLKEFYEKYKKDEIKLYCEYKEELPCGCKPPKRNKK